MSKFVPIKSAGDYQHEMQTNRRREMVEDGAQLLNLHQSIADQDVRSAILVLVSSIREMARIPVSDEAPEKPEADRGPQFHVVEPRDDESNAG